MRQRGLHEAEQAEDVDVEGRLELLVRDVEQVRLPALLARDADEGVDPAELGDGALDELPGVRLVAEVPGDGDGLATRGLDLLDDVVGVGLLLGQVGQDDVGTSRAKAIATAAPMPESAPVITALRPSSRPVPR